jgi:hypothetical protein
MKRKLIGCLSYFGVIAFIFLLNIYTEGKSTVHLVFLLIILLIWNYIIMKEVKKIQNICQRLAEREKDGFKRMS